jgi:hypothetical protein
MKEKFTKHILYNPMLEGLQSAINQAGDDYMLINIVQENQYCYVAIFKRVESLDA